MDNFINTHLTELISSLVTLIVLYIIRFIFIKLTNKKVTDPIRRYFFIQTAGYVVLIAGIVILSMIWVEWIRSVFTFLSLIIGALVITAKELILSLFANIVIFWRSLFSVGDRITIGEYTGDVTELGAFYITLADVDKSGLYSGKTVKIPNNIITTQVVINHSKSGGLVWNVLNYRIKSIENINSAISEIYKRLGEIHYSINDSDRRLLLDSHADLMFRNPEPRVAIEHIDGLLVLKLVFISRIADSFDNKNKITAIIFELADEGLFKIADDK